VLCPSGEFTARLSVFIAYLNKLDQYHRAGGASSGILEPILDDSVAEMAEATFAELRSLAKEGYAMTSPIGSPPSIIESPETQVQGKAASVSNKTENVRHNLDTLLSPQQIKIASKISPGNAFFSLDIKTQCASYNFRRYGTRRVYL